MRNVFTGASIDGDARAACSCRRPGRAMPPQPQRRSANENHAACACQQEKSYQPCNWQEERPACACQQENPCQDQPQPRAWQEDRCACQTSRTACETCPVMVKPQHHGADCLYDARQALLRGTLFQCLDKPMCGERCQENHCITPCQADQFTLWELQLYLDTHPGDQQALSLMRKLMHQAAGVNCSAAPTSDRWTWPDGPWPWEFQCCGGKGA